MTRTVLVVDDDPLVLEVTATMLDNLGCDVVTASTGKEALTLIAAHQRIEILITDVNMPVMCGCELAERARRLRNRLQVVLLSGGRPTVMDTRSFKSFPGTGSRAHCEAH